MKVLSQLEKAQLENRSAVVSAAELALKGFIAYRTDLNKVSVSNGVIGALLVDETTAATLTNKTLTAPVITSQLVMSGQDMFGETSIASPAAGYWRAAVKTDGKLYLRDSAGVEKVIGEGSAGGVNYILNPDANTNVTGWATYLDAAGSAPVDGTGGTATITLTRSTTNPLRGAASFLLTKPASNTQGQGFSFDFTIDRADRTKTLSVSFDHEFLSGTFVTGDLVMWVYDITNAVLIPVAPSPLELTTATGGGKFRGTFQASYNSSAYRLIAHVATVSALAYSFTFDNFIVGPQAIVNGTPVTDWREYPMIITAAGTSPTKDSAPVEDKAYWRRVGDSVEISYTYRGGNGGGATNGSGVYRFGLPPGLTIDTAKISVNAGTGNYGACGGGQLYNNVNSQAQLQINAGANTYLTGVITNASTTTNYDSGSGFALAQGADNRVSFTARVPIVGWSSQVQMSSESDSRTITATGALASTSVPNATFTKLPFLGGSNSSGMLDVANSRIRITVPGSYQFVGLVNWTPPSNANHRAWCAIYKNGSLLWESGQIFPGTLNGVLLSATFPVIDAVAGDYFELWFRQDVGSTATTAAYGYFSCSRVGGSSIVAASDVVSMSYSTVALGAISSNANVILPMQTRDHDTTGSYNTSTGIWTCPVAGKYRITFSCGAYATWTSTNQLIAYIVKNGSNFRSSRNRVTAAITDAFMTVVTCTIDLKANETIAGAVYVAGGTSATVATGSVGSDNVFLDITKVG